MIRLPQIALSAETLAGLGSLQKAVDDAGGYAAQVAQAKKRWDAKPARVFGPVKAA